MDITGFRFNRDSLSPELKNLSLWPTVDTKTLSTKNRNIYLNRERAIQLYLDGGSHAEIQNITGISRSQLHRSINKCLSQHPDGKIFGCRGLLPYVRSKIYFRIAPASNSNKKSGYSGLLIKLLNRHPEIKSVIEDDFLKRTRNNQIHESRIPIKSIHKKFIAACRNAGIHNGEYPFNTSYLGLRGLSGYLKKLFNLHFNEAVSARYGHENGKALSSSGHGPSIVDVEYPYQRVEFDGHKLDLFMVVEVPTIHGDVNLEVIERLWLLTVIDSYSRAILGYTVSMGTEYNKFDVMQTFKKSIVPWKPKTSFSILGLKYKPNAGFPSGTLDDYSWACWNEIAYDNAKANLAEDTKSVLKETIRCQINAGPVKTPERRGILERWHHTLEENGFHRLPSTTGFDPFDPRKNNPEKAAKEHRIKYDQVLELLEVLIADYNATPHSAIGYKTPLEMLKFYASQDYALINRITPSERQMINRLDYRITVTVKGKIEEGRRPYIQFLDARYRNDVLSSSPHLIGKKLTCYVDTEDLRNMVAYLPNGEELGVLVANGKWGVVPHTMRMRKTIITLKKRRVIDYVENDDPVMVYMEYLNQQTPNNKRVGKAFAEAHKSGVPKQPYTKQPKNKCTPPNSVPVQDTSSDVLSRLSKLRGVNK